MDNKIRFLDNVVNKCLRGKHLFTYSIQYQIEKHRWYESFIFNNLIFSMSSIRIMHSNETHDMTGMKINFGQNIELSLIAMFYGTIIIRKAIIGEI